MLRSLASSPSLRPNASQPAQCWPRSLLAWCLSALTLATAPAAEPTATPPRLPVSFNAPAKGFLSLALYDEHHVLTRSLLYAEPVEPGTRTITWDGTTDLGRPAPAGTYTAQGVFFTESPSTKFAMIVGKSGNPPWRTADGTGDWGGNLGFPSSIASNGKSLVLAYAAVEDNQITGVQQMDGAGKIQRRYFTFYPWDGRSASAMDEQNLYLGIYNGGKQTVEIAAYKLGESRGKILAKLPVKTWPEDTETRWRGRPVGQIDGLALTADTLFATVAKNDALFIVDRATGAVRQQISLPAPHGLAVVGDRLLVVSGKKVLRLTLDGAIEATIVDEPALTFPHALAVDAARNLYVGDSGAGGPAGPQAALGTRQVLVFSPEGKLLRKIGKIGGTPQEGRFEENGLGIITALCIGPGADGQPALWVNDIATGFPRTSRWSLEGQFQQQWFGRKISLYSDVLNPARPHELLYTSGAFADEPGISAYEIDIAKKTWRPAWHYDNTWADMFQEDVFLSFQHGGNPYNGPRGKDARWPVLDYDSRNFVSHAGRDYFMSSEGAIYLYGSEHKPKLVALLYTHRSEMRDGKIKGDYDQGPNDWFAWADRNGDGRIALDEINYTANPPMLAKTSRLSEVRLDTNLTIHIKRFVNENRHSKVIDSVLPLKELLPNGAPVYDWTQLRDEVPLQPPDLTGGDGKKVVFNYSLPLPIETPDAFYSLVKPGTEKGLSLPGIDGQGWWAGRNWRTKVVRFDKQTGLPLWAVGRRAPGRAERGQMYHPAALSGVAGGALFVIDTLGPMWVWNTDGLFLGHVFHDFGEGTPDDQTLYGEIQATSVFTDPADGKIYSIANDTGAHIHEIILPKLTPLSAGKVTLTSAQTALAQSWDPDGASPTERPHFQVYPVVKPIAPPKMNGDMDGREGWGQLTNGQTRPEMLILLDDQRLASVRAMYDAQNLYLGYSVSAPHGALNSGSELPAAPFVSGAYVDFTIGPDWQGPRSEVREGDLRVLLARITGGAAPKDFQQGFWQKKAGASNPQTITSPAASVKIDQIAEVPGLQMGWKIGSTDAKRGLTNYTVEVSIPLASLGLTNPAGKTIGFDASVGVANESGDRRERAAHWAGLSEAFVVDRPGSIRLLPETWGTLTFAPDASTK